MNYKKIYESIIIRAKGRQQPECYTEKHHIIPRCMGGQDDESNLAVLTPEEHYVCHQLLVKIYPNDRRLIRAAKIMTLCSNTQVRNNKMFGWLRRKWINSCKGEQRAKRGSKRCKHCNKEFYNTLAKLQTKTFCSVECRGMHKSQEGMKILTCAHCYIETYVKLSRHRAKFCSKDCADASRRFNFTCPVCNQVKILRKSETYYKACSLACSIKLKKR